MKEVKTELAVAPGFDQNDTALRGDPGLFH